MDPTLLRHNKVFSRNLVKIRLAIRAGWRTNDRGHILWWFTLAPNPWSLEYQRFMVCESQPFQLNLKHLFLCLWATKSAVLACLFLKKQENSPSFVSKPKKPHFN